MICLAMANYVKAMAYVKAMSNYKFEKKDTEHCITTKYIVAGMKTVV